MAPGHTPKVEHSVSIKQANLYQMAMLPVVVLFAAVYFMLWGPSSLVSVIKLITAQPVLALPLNLAIIVVFVTGIVVHELIHGFSFVLIGKQPREKVTMIGIQKDTFTPYSHCSAPLEIWAYRWAVAMPGLVLGIIPSVVGVLSGNLWILVFGLLFTFAASGDALILWLSRRVERGSLIEDHPTRVGFYVIEQG